MGFQIAIDGPSGSGKSTIAKLLAKELGFIYIDTGAMYRAVGLYCLNNNIDLLNENEIIMSLDNIKLRLEYKEGNQIIYLNDDDVTQQIRTQQVATIASKNISVIPKVREKLVDMQRLLSKDKDVILDGRDIGTVVLPNANLKIYLDADIDAKTKRRCNELSLLNIEFIESEVRQELIERNNRDSNRLHSPQKKAEDAILIDSSEMTIDEVKNNILMLVENFTNK